MGLGRKGVSHKKTRSVFKIPCHVKTLASVSVDSNISETVVSTDLKLDTMFKHQYMTLCDKSQNL